MRTADLLAFAVGAASAFYSPPWIANGLFGLLVSMLVYGLLYLVAGSLGIRLGHARAVAESESRQPKGERTA